MYTYKAIVTNVVDGDTVDVNVDLGFKVYSKQRIRLSGIDTPERGQPGYQEAKDRVIELVLDKEVMLLTSKASKFGYYLGMLMIQDNGAGVFVNTILLEENLAKLYDGGKKES